MEVEAELTTAAEVAPTDDNNHNNKDDNDVVGVGVGVGVEGEGDAALMTAAVTPTDNNNSNNNNHNNKDNDDKCDHVVTDINVVGVGEAAPTTTTAAVAPTGGDSVQGTWSTYAMAAVALFLVVCGVGAYLLTRSVDPLIPLINKLPINTPYHTPSQ